MELRSTPKDMSGKRWSMYVHPWDVIEEGSDHVLKQLQSMGISTINIATSYHTGRYILPHNPKRRIYLAEDGVIYFNKNEEFFKNCRIKPRKSQRFNTQDVLKDLSDKVDKYDIEISSWTVFLHNRAFVQEYPDLAMMGPFGNRDENYLCPNRTETRKYISALSKNIIDSYGVDTIQLESPSYPTGLIHGNHHETFGVRVDPIVSFLFSMCYCDYCKEKALEYDINIEAKLPMIMEIIDRGFNSETDLTSNLPPEEFVKGKLEKYGLEKLLDFRELTTDEIFSYVTKEVREINPNAKVEAIANSETYVNEGISLRHPPEGVSGIDLISYYPDLKTILSKVEYALEAINGKTRLFPCIRFTYPMIQQSRQIEWIVESLNQLDISGINFYNYGWATQSRLEELSRALRNL